MSPLPPANVILSDPLFLSELRLVASESDNTQEEAFAYARKCLKEIEATPKDSWLQPAVKLARFIYTRSYDPELDVNLDKLEELRELSKDHLLLFLWSHKSHMDSFVFLLSLFYNGFRPLPLIFAGINMNFLGFGALARRVGAIFLRRSFAEDAIYKLVFRHYINFLVRKRAPLSWSIEGTRSRTGKLSPPKLGILSWVVEACEQEQSKKVLLVPVSIAFDRIAEINDYVALQSGQPKRRESLRWFINYVFGMRAGNGKVYVRFGEPIPLETTDQTAGADKPSARQRRLALSNTAFEICRRIEQITPIKSADILSMVLLGANQRALTATEIYQQTAPLTDMITRRNLPTGSGLRLHSQKEVTTAIQALADTGLIHVFAEAQEPVYYIAPRQQLAAAYYSNTITHYFLRAALGEIGLAKCELDIDRPSATSLKRHVLGLRELYKFEFFFTSSEEFWNDVATETQQRYPDWDNGEYSVQKRLQDQPPCFGHAMLRSITEAYLVMAAALMELDTRPVHDQKKFVTQLLAQGRKMLLQKTISCESSVSQDLFTNGLRLAGHLALLDGRPADLAEARKAFATRVFAAYEAINLLQRCYDSAWSNGALSNSKSTLSSNSPL